MPSLPRSAAAPSGVLVLGAGVIGLATALALRERGLAVTVIEAAERPAAQASWAGGGILCPLRIWEEPAAVQSLFRASRETYPAWADALHRRSGIDIEWRPTGIEWRLPAAALAAAEAWHRDEGLPFQREADRLWSPTLGQVRSPRLGKALVAALAAAGVPLRLGSPAQLWIEQGRVRGLICDGTPLAAAAVVVAAGAWSGELLAAAGLRLDVQPVKGQMLRLASPGSAARPVTVGEGIYVIPRADDQVLVGSTVEHVGFDTRPTPEARERLRTEAEALCPWLRDAPLLQHWAGLRPGSPEGVPSIGPGPLPGLWLNTGHHRNGLALAPTSAERLAGALAAALADAPG